MDFKRSAIISTLFLISILKIVGQSTDSLQSRLDKFNEHFRPEYIDSHTDRDIYFSGDRLWYTLYLYDTKLSSPLSIAGYTELRDQNDSVVYRQKLKISNGTGFDEFIIPKHLTTGIYQFVAYTLWMKNTGELSYHRKFIAVVNSDFPYQKMPSSHNVPYSAPFVSRSGKILSIAEPAQGMLIIYTPDRVLEVRNVKNHNEQITVPDYLNPLYASFFDKRGARHDITLSSIDSSLVLKTNKDIYQQRENISLEMQLRDQLGNPMNGNVSVSVHRNDGMIQYPQTNVPVGLWSTNNGNQKYKKEIFFYPKMTSGSPPKITRAAQAVPFQIGNSEILSTVIEKSDRNKKILKAYDLKAPEINSKNYLLSFNLSYRPEDYTDFSTLESFINEIVAQVKLRKSNFGKSAFIRNSENSSNVYFFKNPALLLADGIVIKSVDEILNIDLSDIERIDIMWGAKEINSSGVFSLADNGILSITTKSQSTIFSGEKLFEDVHVPGSFSIPSSSSSDDSLPFFYSPVYWNPYLRIEGSNKISFVASDELGEFIIRVKGITNEGKLVISEKKIKIAYKN